VQGKVSGSYCDINDIGDEELSSSWISQRLQKIAIKSVDLA
jgi:hypothetical protein